MVAGSHAARRWSRPAIPLPRRWAWLGVALPLLVVAVLLALDLSSGPKPQYVGLLVAAPFLASALAGASATALVGVLTLAAATAIGFLQRNDALTGSAASSTPQLVRLGFILASVLLATTLAALTRSRNDRIDRLQQISEVAQRTILRDLPSRVGWLDCAARYHSASSEARVGGDLYEVLLTPFGVRAVVGDARGKGLAAVRLSGYLLGSFREVVWTERDLAQVALALHRAVARVAGPEDFLTATLVEIGPDGEVRTVLCGHPAPLLVDPAPDGPARPRSPWSRLLRRREPPVLPELRPLRTGRPAPPLGLVDAAPEVGTDHLHPGQRLLLLTDGVLEARRRGRYFDVPAAVRSAFRAEDLDAALDQVIRQVHHHVRGRVEDDLALLALRLPHTPPAGMGSLGLPTERPHGLLEPSA